MIFIICFVFRIVSEQRFHQKHHGRMMLQRHVRCSSVQHVIWPWNSYLIKNANFHGKKKKWCLAFNALLTLAALFDYVVTVDTCEMFCFHRYGSCASQICIDLTTGTSNVTNVAKFVYFLETTMYECSIFWMNMMVCSNLVVNSMLFWLGVMPGRPC